MNFQPNMWIRKGQLIFLNCTNMDYKSVVYVLLLQLFHMLFEHVIRRDLGNGFLFFYSIH